MEYFVAVELAGRARVGVGVLLDCEFGGGVRVSKVDGACQLERCGVFPECDFSSSQRGGLATH